MSPIAESNGARVYLLDASIYIFRYYFSMPNHWWSELGYPTETVYGFTRFLVKLLVDVRPKYIAACFDESLGSCFRNQIYPGYKASRVLPDENLAFQLAACREITELMGVNTYHSETHEADDLIGTLVHRCRRKSLPVTLITRDKDLAQLMSGDDEWWDYPDGLHFDYPTLQDHLGLQPGQMADYLALVGDSVDDIPGVPGLGPKTAKALLSKFDNVEALFNDLGSVAHLPIRGASGLVKKLEQYREQIRLAHCLTKIATNAPLGRRYAIKLRKPDIPVLREFVRKLGITTRVFDSLKTGK